MVLGARVGPGDLLNQQLPDASGVAIDPGLLNLPHGTGISKCGVPVQLCDACLGFPVDLRVSMEPIAGADLPAIAVGGLAGALPAWRPKPNWEQARIPSSITGATGAVGPRRLRRMDSVDSSMRPQWWRRHEGVVCLVVYPPESMTACTRFIGTITDRAKAARKRSGSEMESEKPLTYACRVIPFMRELSLAVSRPDPSQGEGGNTSQKTPPFDSDDAMPSAAADGRPFRFWIFALRPNAQLSGAPSILIDRLQSKPIVANDDPQVQAATDVRELLRTGFRALEGSLLHDAPGDLADAEF